MKSIFVHHSLSFFVDIWIYKDVDVDLFHLNFLKSALSWPVVSWRLYKRTGLNWAERFIYNSGCMFRVVSILASLTSEHDAATTMFSGSVCVFGVMIFLFH